MSGEESVSVDQGDSEIKIIYQWRWSSSALGYIFFAACALASVGLTGWMIYQRPVFRQELLIPVYGMVCSLFALVCAGVQREGRTILSVSTRHSSMLRLGPGFWSRQHGIRVDEIRYLFVEANLFSPFTLRLFGRGLAPAGTGYCVVALLQNGQKIYLVSNIKTEACAHHIENEIREMVRVSTLPAVHSHERTRPTRQRPEADRPSPFFRRLKAKRSEKTTQAGIYERVSPLDSAERLSTLVTRLFYVLIIGHLALVLQIQVNWWIGSPLLAAVSIVLCLLVIFYLRQSQSQAVFQRGSALGFARVQDRRAVRRWNRTLYQVKINLLALDKDQSAYPLFVWATVDPAQYDRMTEGEALSVCYATAKPHILFFEEEARLRQRVSQALMTP